MRTTGEAELVALPAGEFAGFVSWGDRVSAHSVRSVVQLFNDRGSSRALCRGATVFPHTPSAALCSCSSTGGVRRVVQLFVDRGSSRGLCRGAIVLPHTLT